MEGNSHHSVGIVECLLHSISVVDVNVQVENSGVNFQQLKNADDDVVNVAESTSL